MESKGREQGGESPRESGGLRVEGTKSDRVQMLDVVRVEVRRSPDVGHREGRSPDVARIKVEGRVGRATREARDKGRLGERTQRSSEVGQG